jgi:hypothetical protein
VKPKQIPAEALLELRRRLQNFPPRSAERRSQLQQFGDLYGVSESTVYRALRTYARPKALRRADCGSPRIIPKRQMVHFCEVIAALQVRTANKKGRHLSTAESIRLLEEHGVETPVGLVRADQGLLKTPTVNRYLNQWGYNRRALCRPPPAVHFQARHSSECWQFDLSPSDLKKVKTPVWIDPDRGHPLLMIYSLVDDRSGVAYQEYHGVYGEDVQAALRFLFNAMAPKDDPDNPFQGIPAMIYTDNGPVARSLVFQKVLGYLGIELRTHMPAGKDGRRTTARSKGKVERPFRTVKEIHETLFHLHAPETEAEANAGLQRYLVHYNQQPHRKEPHSRIEDWLENMPHNGLREMCNWERFCTFAREPERRRVNGYGQVTIEGVSYEVDSDLAGEDVVLWWGLFDNELYVEHGDKRYGPYSPVGGPIPLNRYRRLKKSKSQRQADRIDALASQLALPASAVDYLTKIDGEGEPGDPPAPTIPFDDPDPFQEQAYRNAIDAKRAIASTLGIPLAKLAPDQMEALNRFLDDTLEKTAVMDYIRTQLRPALSAER